MKTMQLSTDKMLAEKADGIGWMTFNNPERHNAVSVEMREAMLEILTDFRDDDQVRVIVMKGAGERAFVSGADISQFEQQRATEEQRKAYAELSDRVNVLLVTMPKPVIAMIRGYCLGGGLAIALTADIRIAAEGSRFGIPAARLGLGYPYRSVKALMDVVGGPAAKEILFTAHRFEAADALRMGLVNRVVAADALEETVREMAQTIAGNAPLTVQASKTIINEALKDTGDRDLALCDRVADACFESQDYVEGRRAFMEKRKPEFTGS